MKRMKLWLCCGLLLALLGGCGDDAKTPDGSLQGQSPEQNISGENQEDSDNVEGDGNQTETVDTPQIDVPEVHYEAIPEHWQPMDTKGILWQVPIAEVEELGLFEVRNVGENLYICRPRWNDFEFIKMDYANGTILQETTVDLNLDSRIQTLENGIVVYSSQNGKIVVLNTDLQVVNEFKTNVNDGEWYFGKDGSILYNFSYEGTLSCTNLFAEETNVLIETMWNYYAIGSNENYVNFCYTDLVGHTINYLCLDLQTGQLEAIPFKEEMLELSRKENVWFGRSLNSEELYKIYNEKQEMNTIGNLEDSFYGKRFLMSGQEHILTVDGETMTLHDYQGNFISKCQLPTDYRLNLPSLEPENYFMWDEIHGGYYFLCDYTPEANQFQRILFWDIDVEVSGNDLALIGEEQTEPETDKFLELPEVYKKAQRLSDKYGLDIKIGKDASCYGVQGKQVLDGKQILAELSLIASIMQVYGTDYVEENILHAEIGSVEIHLLKDLEEVGGISESFETVEYRNKVNFYLTGERGRFILHIDVEHATAMDYKEAFGRMKQSKENWEYNYKR